MDEKAIVILGGSYGGLSVAHHVLKHTIPVLSNPNIFQVIVISGSSQTVCRQACPRAMINESMFNQSKLFVNIDDQFQQYGPWFKFIHGKAISLNTSERTVLVSSHGGATIPVQYHALVIATGATASSPLHGLQDDAKDLKNCWLRFRKALSEARNVVIAGGGPTGVETAGELGEYCNGWNKDPKVAITLVVSGRILPQLRLQLAEQAERYLKQVGVTLIRDTKVQSTVPASAGVSLDDLIAPTTVTLSDGSTIIADIFIPAYGTRPNTDFAPSSILAADGRVKTNPALRVDEAGPRVYALGDVCDAARPAVHAILAQVPIVGKNIKRDLLLDSITPEKADQEDISFQEDHRESQLVPIGTKKGVGAMMGFKLPSFLVWLVKGRDYWLWTTARIWSGKQWT